jgi:hypothetical protein
MLRQVHSSSDSTVSVEHKVFATVDQAEGREIQHKNEAEKQTDETD